MSLDLVWLRDESLEDMDNLPPPEVIAQEIVEDLEVALAEFARMQSHSVSRLSTTPRRGEARPRPRLTPGRARSRA